MDKLTREKESLSVLKKDLERRMKLLENMQARFGLQNDPDEIKRYSIKKTQHRDVSSRISEINKIMKESDRDLVTSTTVFPMDTVVDMSLLLNMFHNNIITKLAKNIVPVEDLASLSTKEKKIDYITKNIPKHVYLEAVRSAINEMSGDELNKAIKYIKNKYNMLEDVKLDSAVPQRKTAVKKFVYNTFIKDPSKRNPTKLPRRATQKIAEFVHHDVKAGKRKTYKKKSKKNM